MERKSKRPTATNEPQAKKQKVEAVEASEKYSQVGYNHQMLNSAYVGSWDYKVEFYMQPGAPPKVSMGTSEYKSVLNGLYVEGVYRGEANFVTEASTPFEGKDVIGYDSFSSKFVIVWMDNMASSVMMTTGDYDEFTRTLTTTGLFPNLACGRGMETIKTETIFAGDLTKGPIIYRLLKLTETGEYQLSMQVTSTRRTKIPTNNFQEFQT